MDNTYEAITNYLDEKRLEAKDMFIEQYVTDPLTTNEDNLVVNVYRHRSNERGRAASSAGGEPAMTSLDFHTSPGRNARKRSAGIPAIASAHRRAHERRIDRLVGELERAVVMAERALRAAIDETPAPPPPGSCAGRA